MTGVALAAPHDTRPHRTVLSDLLPGESASLAAPKRCTAAIVRLMEMGMTAGQTVQVIRKSAWSGPMVVLVRGTRLCLRVSEARFFGIDDVTAPERT